MDKTLVILGKLSFLKIPPNAWDAIFPHGPKVSPFLREYLAAGVARDVAARVRDKKIAANVMEIGKEMVRSASGGLIQGWEDGDDICPPWPPFPPRSWWQWIANETQEPEPVPWKSASTEQVVLADVLTSLSEMTSQRELGARLREAASGIIAGVSRRLVKDFQAAA